MAIAADAPQIAVAPPDRTPKRGSNPIQRAASVDAPIVSATAATTSRSGLQPSEVTSAIVIFRPKSATPRRSTNFDVKAMPGLQRSTSPRKFMASPIRSANSMIGPPVWLATRPAAPAITTDATNPGATPLSAAQFFTAMVFMRFRQLRFQPMCCVQRSGRLRRQQGSRRAATASRPSSPMRSASQPVRIGPGARPNALFASVRTANAVPCSAAGVRFATIAPAGPAEAAAKNMPAPRNTSCGVPAPRLIASVIRTRTAEAVAHGKQSAVARRAHQLVADHPADDHSGAADREEERGKRRCLVERQVVVADEIGRQPGRQRRCGEQR